MGAARVDRGCTFCDSVHRAGWGGIWCAEGRQIHSAWGYARVSPRCLKLHPMSKHAFIRYYHELRMNNEKKHVYRLLIHIEAESGKGRQSGMLRRRPHPHPPPKKKLMPCSTLALVHSSLKLARLCKDRAVITIGCGQAPSSSLTCEEHRLCSSMLFCMLAGMQTILGWSSSDPTFI